MATEATLAFTDDNFDTEVINSEMPVLVDFWAEWCQPCKKLGPTIDELATEYEGQVKIGKMDMDANMNTAVKLGIASIPTVIIFKGGEIVGRIGGLKEKQVFVDAIKEVL